MEVRQTLIDYVVHRNWAADKKYKINDSEGLMHEDHVNSLVLDSKLIDNRGNSYISIYKTGGINGLLVKGNDIRTSGGISAIYVVANRNSGPFECKNVKIIGNITAGSGIQIAGNPAENNVIKDNRHIGGSGIQIAGNPAENNVIKDNRHIGGSGKLVNEADARCRNNIGYDEVKK